MSLLNDRTLCKHWSIYLQLHTTWVVASPTYFQCQPIIYAQARICSSLQVLVLQCCRGGCKVWYWPCAECTADTELRPEFGQYRDIRQSQHCLVPGAHLPCCRPPASSLLPRGANFGQSLFELCVTQQSLYQKLKTLSNTEICRCSSVFRKVLLLSVH